MGAVLLAAGRSTRMNEIKQLLPVQGKPAAAYCIDHMMEAGIDDIVAVLGHERFRVAAALSGYRICMAVNDDAESDMAGSAAIGLAAMPGYATGVIICPCDHPLVTADTYAKLVELHHRFPDKIIIPTFDFKNGHPALFPVDICKPVSQGVSLNRIIARHRNRVFYLTTRDPGVVHDMDTPADYRQIVRLSGEMAAQMPDRHCFWT